MGVFVFDNGTRVFIPTRLRLVHNQPIRTRAGEVQCRSEHPGAFGRSTSTLILRSGDQWFLPFIAQPFTWAEIALRHEWSHDTDRRDYWMHNEILPHCRTWPEKVAVMRQMRALLEEPHNPKGEHDLSAMRYMEVETSAEQYAQLLRQSTTEANVDRALQTGCWSARRSGVTIRVESSWPEDVLVEQLRTIVVRQATTRGRLVGQRQITRDTYGFFCPLGSPDGDNIGLRIPLAIHAFVDPIKLRVARFVGPYRPGVGDLLTDYSHLGFLAAQHPFTEHTQGARASLACGSRRHFLRDGVQMMNGEAPLVCGPVAPLGNDGVNLLVAFISDASNVEDAIIMNRATAERGVFYTVLEKVHATESKKRTVGELYESDISGESGRVAWVGPKEFRVVVEARPEPGDKISNRHGQKGVISELRAPEHMPVVVGGPHDGKVPDIIVNGVMAIPKRMTIGMLLEMRGPNGEFPEDGVYMRDNRTGELYPSRIAFGPVWYGRMQQMAASKLNVRGAKGPINPLTRAPVKGRRQGGGVTWGHMEFDGATAHGAFEVVRERVRDLCDPVVVYECATCASRTLTPTCPKCKTTGTRREVPYATQLMMDELLTAGIRVYE